MLAPLLLTLLSASVSLKYERPDGAGCPDEAVLRQLVAARLGADPFSIDGTSQVTVRLTALTAEVLLASPGAPERRKTLTAADCVELVQSVAVAVALAVDPLLKRPEPAPAPPPVEPAPEPKPPAPHPPPAPPAAPLGWVLSAGAGVNLGLAPVAQPVLRLEGRLRGERWSIGLEGRFHWPVTGAVSGGALTTSAVLGAAVPCLHWAWLSGCADLSLGALRLEGSALAGARAASVFHASVGLRVLFTVPLGDRLSVGAMADGSVPLTRATAAVGTERVWTVWPVGAGLSAFFGVRL